MEYFRWVMLIIGLIILFIVIWLTRQEQLKHVANSKKSAYKARKRLGLADDNKSYSESDEKEERELKQKIKAIKTAILTKSTEEDEVTEEKPMIISQDENEEEGKLNSARFLVKPAEENTLIPEHPDTAKNLPDKMFVVHIKGKKNIYGKILMEAFKKANLVYGDMNIFHYKVDGDTLFSVANMVKPGDFDLGKMHEFMTPGLTLFMRLPGPRSGRTILVRYLMTIHALAEELDGIILDENRQPLNYEDLHSLEEEASRYPAVSKKQKAK